MKYGARGRGESVLRGGEDRRVGRAGSGSSAEHKSEAETQRGKARRRANGNRSLEVAPLTPVASQIGVDRRTELVAE